MTLNGLKVDELGDELADELGEGLGDGLADGLGELEADVLGGLNTSSRLTMAVSPPGTSKCHPSRYAGTKPAQLPVVAKPAAVVGSAVFGSSGIWYGLPNVEADPIAALVATTAPTTATTPASRHPVRRAVLLNTASSLAAAHLSSGHFRRKNRPKHFVDPFHQPYAA
jgi:hypothetical protein